LSEGPGTPSDAGVVKRYACYQLPTACTTGQPTCACAGAAIPRCSEAEVCSCREGAPGTLSCVCRGP
jgi:hypothetical protein